MPEIREGRCEPGRLTLLANRPFVTDPELRSGRHNGKTLRSSGQRIPNARGGPKRCCFERALVSIRAVG
jgi:hypothetical protein